MPNGNIDELISAIYEAPLNLDAWGTAVDSLAEHMGASGGGQFYLFDQNRGEVLFSRMPPWMSREGEAAYHEHYVAIDPRRAVLDGVGVGEWIFDQDHFNKRFVSRSEIFQFLKSYGIRYAAAIKPFSAPGLIAILSLFRSPDQAEFSTSDRQTLGRLSAHLTRAATLTMQLSDLRERSRIGLAALDAAPDAMVVVDQQLRIMFHNRAAEVLFRDASYVRQTAKHFSISSVEETRRIKAAVNAAITQKVGGALRVATRGRGIPIFCQVLPVPSSTPLTGILPQGLALLVFRESSATDAQVQVIAALYGLTSAEARVAQLIASGSTPEQASLALHISVNTVRAHLKQLFQKTQVHRQADLLALLKSVPV